MSVCVGSVRLHTRFVVVSNITGICKQVVLGDVSGIVAPNGTGNLFRRSLRVLFKAGYLTVVRAVPSRRQILSEYQTVQKDSDYNYPYRYEEPGEYYYLSRLTRPVSVHMRHMISSTSTVL
jgi:hypothetical protein